MWLVVTGLCGLFFMVGLMIGVVYMKQANDEYKAKLERALKDAKAPYEVLARDINSNKQEVKNDESAWW